MSIAQFEVMLCFLSGRGEVRVSVGKWWGGGVSGTRGVTARMAEFWGRQIDCSK